MKWLFVALALGSALASPAYADDESRDCYVVLVGSVRNIVDANNNHWGITGRRQVTVNMQHDPKTSNVRRMMYQDKKVWFEDEQGLWRWKLTPSDEWQPVAGMEAGPSCPPRG